MIRRYVSVGIVGAGQMGGGIAQVAAQNGISVVLMDANETGLKSSKALMGTSRKESEGQIVFQLFSSMFCY